MRTIAILLASFVLSCSDNGGPVDAGPDAEDGWDGGDQGADELGPPFRLVFEDGAQACARFGDWRTAAEELALRGHMRFAAGTVELPRDMTSARADLVEEIRITGPDPVDGVPDAAGEITHREETALWGWCHHYTYTHPFHAGARPLVVQATFSFCKRHGQADPEELRFDSDQVGEEPRGLVDDHQVDVLGLVDNGEDYRTEKQFYRSCTYTTLPRHRVTVDLGGSDRIVIDRRYQAPPMASGPVSLTGAEVDLDDQQRTVDDYFRMAYACDQHNFNERYLIVLDPPISGIHGIHFEEANQNDPPTVVDLLDASLDPQNPLEQRPVEGYLDEEIP